MSSEIEAKQPLSFIHSLVTSKHYLEALSRYTAYLKIYPKKLPHILIDLYKSLQKDTDDINIRLIIADLYIKHADYDAALDECITMLELDPMFSQTYFLLSKLYQKKYKLPEICRLFQQAFDNGSRDSIIIDLLPKLYMDSYNYSAAIVFFETLIAEDSAGSHHSKALAELYKLTGYFEKSTEIYASLIEKNPEFLADGIDLCERILAQHSYFTSIRKQVILFYFKACNPDATIVHLTTLKQDSAVPFSESYALFCKSMDLFPNHQPTLYSLCLFLITHNQLTDALELLKKLAEDQMVHQAFIDSCVKTIHDNTPHHPGFKLFYIEWHLQCNHIETALNAIESMVAVLPSADILSQLALYLENILKKEPPIKGCTVSYLLATCYFLLKQFSKAEEHIQQCAPLLFRTIQLQAKVNAAQNQHQEALSTLKTASESTQATLAYHQLFRDLYQKKLSYIQTSTPSKSLELATIQLQQTSYTEAIETLQQITKDNTHYPTAQVLLLRCFMSNHQFEHASSLAAHIIPFLKSEESPLYPHALFLYSICLHHTFKFQKAYQILTEIECINIVHPHVAPLKEYTAALSFQQHQGFLCTGLIDQWNGSIRPYTLGNSLESSLQTSQLDTMSFGMNHNNQGCLHLMNNTIANATKAFSLTQQLSPDLAVSYCNMALVYLLEHKPEKATEQIKKAKDIRGSTDAIAIMEALIYHQTGEPTRAITCLQQCLEKNPHNKHASFNLAAIYILNNHIELGFETMKTCEKLGLFFIPISHLFCYRSALSPTSALDWIKPLLYENTHVTPH